MKTSSTYVRTLILYVSRRHITGDSSCLVAIFLLFLFFFLVYNKIL